MSGGKHYTLPEFINSQSHCGEMSAQCFLSSEWRLWASPTAEYGTHSLITRGLKNCESKSSSIITGGEGAMQWTEIHPTYWAPSSKNGTTTMPHQASTKYIKTKQCFVLFSHCFVCMQIYTEPITSTKAPFSRFWLCTHWFWLIPFPGSAHHLVNFLFTSSGVWFLVSNATKLSSSIWGPSNDSVGEGPLATAVTKFLCPSLQIWYPKHA